MNIGQRIKSRRKELKMSADELASRLGKDRSTIYRYEKGDIENLPLDILDPIAKALDTTPAYLMGWDHKEEPEELADIAAKVLTNDKAKHMVELYFELNDSEQDLVMNLMETLKNKKTDDAVSQVGIVSSQEKV